MCDTTFYFLVHEALSRECKRLCDFTDNLDKNQAEKKQQIAEYKCAKYRYASVSLIDSTVYNINRCRKTHNLKEFHYLLLPFDEIFKKHDDYLSIYDSAPDAEKPDIGLYYAMIALADVEIVKLEEKISVANDWEKIELEERIGGLKFAKICLDEAWQKRKDVL